MQGALAHVARRLGLIVGPVRLVVQSENLGGTLVQVSFVNLKGVESRDIDVAEIQRRLTLDDPFSQRASRAGAELDTLGIISR